MISGTGARPLRVWQGSRSRPAVRRPRRRAIAHQPGTRYGNGRVSRLHAILGFARPSIRSRSDHKRPSCRRRLESPRADARPYSAPGPSSSPFRVEDRRKHTRQCPTRVSGQQARRARRRLSRTDYTQPAGAGIPDPQRIMTASRPAALAGGPIRPRVAIAVLSMAAAAFLSSLMHAGVRLSSEELTAFQIAFIRTSVSCAVLAPLLLLPRNRGAWRSRRPRLQVIRGIIGTGAVVTWFHALTVVPLAQAAALSFTLSIFVTAGAAVFLRERVGARRWSAVAAGILGAMIILRPGVVEVSWGAVEVIISSALWGATLLMTKRLSPYDGNLTIVLYMSAIVSVVLALPVLTQWVDPTPRVALIAVGLGCTERPHRTLDRERNSLRRRVRDPAGRVHPHDLGCGDRLRALR